MPPENSADWEKWDMLTGAAPVMKAATQGALCALGLGRVAVALGACLLPDMPPAGAGASQIGSFGVTGNGGTPLARANLHAHAWPLMVKRNLSKSYVRKSINFKKGRS